MSRTAMVGRPPFSRTQCVPPSIVKNAPNSVPANSRFGLTVSSANASTGPFSGRSPAIDVHVLPAFVDFSRYGLKSSFL